MHIAAHDQSVEGNKRKPLAGLPVIIGGGSQFGRDLITGRIGHLLYTHGYGHIHGAGSHGHQRAAGEESFFVFTRPEHAVTFEALRFRLLATHQKAALLELGGGLAAWLERHAALARPGRNGAVVVNGNPFTLGHQHLVETASRQVDTLYLFVVREDRSVFPFAARYRLAQEATRHLPNVVPLDTGRYAVSAATFPTYFLKRLDEVAEAQIQLDVRVFGAHLAPPFGIWTRFVGEEPFDATTAAYNRAMREVLPQYGVALVEIARRGGPDGPISATRVRAALARRDFDAIGRMVPEPTLAYLRSAEGLAVAERLAQSAVGLPHVSKPPTMIQPLSSASRFMIVGLSSKDLSLIRMSVLARWTIGPRLMGVPGVAHVAIWGNRDRQLQVQVDPARLPPVQRD